MCGICGIIYFNGASASRDLIKKMSRAIHHRGPDDEGAYIDGAVGLGQMRLSINDLRHEATAPLSNEDGSIWVVFNGEIYNFESLRDSLRVRGHVFRTETDTEVILHAYEEYGHDCLAYFNGMFAFALWDGNRRELFCARDRFGKKPFCYTIDRDRLIFGSEIKAITADPSFSFSPDYRALDVYLSCGYIPSPLSAFSGISKLRPGCYMVCKNDGTHTVARYWSPPYYPQKCTSSITEIKDELRHRVMESVKMRMVADVPLGAFLSGGIDSTSIVALMAQASNSPIKTFSIGFKDEVDSELPYARMLSDLYQTDHHEFVIEPNCVDDLPHLVRHFNEPFADSSAIPTYYISKMARSHVTVAISGDGGDELFGGYSRYADMSKWSAMSRAIRRARPLLNRLERGIDALPYNNSLAKASRGLHMLGNELPSQYALQMSAGLKRHEKLELYTKEFWKDAYSDGCADSIFGDIAYQDMDPIDYCMLHDQSYYLPDDLMVKSDIASMANSLEVRAPLLDYSLAEYAATLPVELKRRDGFGKWIFRETMRDLLPSQILEKPKTGFSIPKARWLRHDLNGLSHDVLLDGKAKSRGIFDIRKVGRLLKEHESCKRDWGNRLWTMLVLEIWFREFVDRA